MSAPVGPLRPLTPSDAAAIATWRYEPPFDLYDSTGGADDYEPPDEHGFGYWVVDADQVHGGDASGESGSRSVVAFVCVGPEGRVPGQDDEPGTLDIGMGVRPDAVSQGVASSLVPAVLDAVIERWAPRRLRTAVAAFNERSLRLCRSAGLAERRRFAGPGGREFVEMVRDAASAAADRRAQG